MTGQLNDFLADCLAGRLGDWLGEWLDPDWPRGSAGEKSVKIKAEYPVAGNVFAFAVKTETQILENFKHGNFFL